MQLTKNTFDPQELIVEESLFHTANGYLGVRGNFEEGYPAGTPSIRGCYINGYYDTVALSYPEKLFGFPEEVQRMVNLPDAQTTRIQINGETFSLFTGTVLDYSRVLDTEKGIASRSIRWRSPGGTEAEIVFRRMASFRRRQLFLSLIDVRLPGGGDVVFTSEVTCDVANFVDPEDPRTASEHQQHIYFDETLLLEDGGAMLCHTGGSKLPVATCQRHRLAREAAAQDAGTIEPERTASGFLVALAVHLQPGEPVTLEKYTLYSDGRHSDDALACALDDAAECMRVGKATLLAEQIDYLDAFRENTHVEIEGDPASDEGMTFNQYELLQSTGRDGLGNIAAKGLSGEGYEGHYFWDTEIYIFPFFLLTQPEIAVHLLDFRYRVLDGARAHARTLGHKSGAFYPWRTITGSECSAYFPSGSAQYHITGDVAHSFLQYYWMTGDLSYMEEKGAEVLIETARAWLEIGHYDRKGRFCIQDVTGPDEYTCIVNNNYYTNLSAKNNLMGAADIYEELRANGRCDKVRDKIHFDEIELEQFRRAALAMFLPYDAELGIHAQDDSFLDKPVWDFAATPAEKYPLLLHYFPLTLYRHQVCKQADTILAHYLYDEGLDEEVMRRSYEYYERITTHDSTLSVCIFSIMAARLGLGDRAYDYFTHCIRTDMDNTHKNTKDGLHTANMGGAYLALTAGFAGLRIRRDGIHFHFTLPGKWDGYSFKLWHKGSRLRFSVKKEMVYVTLEKGDAVRIFVDEAAYEISAQDATVAIGSVCP